MFSHLHFAAVCATTALAALGLAYFVAAMLATLRFLAERNQPLARFAPGVSVLKSLKGLDPSMMEAFRSHCRQQYAGEYELLFGVADPADPAAEAVRALQQEFPELPIQLLVCPEPLGTNGKISTLAQMQIHARYNYLLINDSDIFASPHYLQRVMALFAPDEAAPPVGMVTSLYRGRAHGTVWSHLEALGIATDFQAGVLLSKVIEGGLHYGLGSTLAVRRSALEAAGGLESLVNQLADDHEMGRQIDEAGFKVLLTTEVVETGVPAYEWQGFCDHQLRWLRTVRDARPGGYFGMIFTHGFAWAVVNLLVSRASWLSCWLLLASLALRLAMAVLVGSIALKDSQVLRRLWLVPVRDLVQLGLWVAGFAGSTIVWRGERFVLKHGKLYGQTK
jgi:ceramide glucosyltransferase